MYMNYTMMDLHCQAQNVRNLDYVYGVAGKPGKFLYRLVALSITPNRRDIPVPPKGIFDEIQGHPLMMPLQNTGRTAYIYALTALRFVV